MTRFSFIWEEIGTFCFKYIFFWFKCCQLLSLAWLSMMVFGGFLDHIKTLLHQLPGHFMLITGGCASNLLPPLFSMFCLRAKWLSWLQIAVSSPTATAGTLWPTARQQGTGRCWRWGVNWVIPQGCNWILSSEACGVSVEGENVCDLSLGCVRRLYLMLSLFFFCLSE